jgi:hypothetical protein
MRLLMLLPAAVQEVVVQRHLLRLAGAHHQGTLADITD